jgi:hypothetical protein
MSSGSIAIRDPLELLTEIANTLALDADRNKVIWLCEGPDDKLAIEHHDPHATAFVAGNRRAVIDCAAKLATMVALTAPRWVKTRASTWFLVDRDYHNVDSLPNRVATTTKCSLEADLSHAAGTKAVRALATGIQIDEAAAALTAAVSAAAHLGCVRKYAHDNGLALRLRGFPVARVLDSSGIDWDGISSIVHERHPEAPSTMTAEIIAAMQAARETAARCTDPLSLANGHDLVSAIQRIVNLRAGNRRVSVPEVFRALVSNADPEKIEWLQLPSNAHSEKGSTRMAR